MKNLFFITAYDSIKSGRNLVCTPSGITYSDYLIDSFSKLSDKKVQVLSLAYSKYSVYISRKKINNKKHDEIYFASLPIAWGMWAVRISQLWLYTQIFFYLLVYNKKDDFIVVYNDFGLTHFLKIFHIFIHCKFVYLIGEIYSAVYDRGNKSIKAECDRLKDANAFIYANDIMPSIFNTKKNYCVCYGNYKYKDTPKIAYNQIHILYAGKISTGIINDAFLALNVIKYLPENYRMHIAGYGTDNDIFELKERINEINNARGERVKYEGNLRGDKFENLLSKCQIGLCTRTLRNELSNYCFPSKTLVYMAHDILPICPQIDVLKVSKISERISFVEGELTPTNIAKTIESSKERIKKYNNKSFMEALDKDFVKDLNNILCL